MCLTKDSSLQNAYNAKEIPCKYACERKFVYNFFVYPC